MLKRPWLWISLAGIVIGISFFVVWRLRPASIRTTHLVEWLRDPQNHLEWRVQSGTRCTPETPFLMPTDGLIGYIWDDSFRPGHRHSGLDIFGGEQPGVTPVVSAYPGYLTRLPVWKSAVIVRVPEDPLQPTRQIWLYYTHMADPSGNSFISADFPPGTSEMYIEAGTFLGFQGNYTGDPYSPSGVHLHFSIVRSDASGQFLNELEIENTLDPSPYFGIPLDRRTAPDGVPVCTEGS
jgi:hypothetical protein